MSEEIKDSQNTAETTSKKESCKCYFANNKKAAYAAVGAICLIIGLLIGSFFLGGPSSALGASTVPESKLGETIATYNYNGNHSVSIRDIMEAQGSVDFYKTRDEQGNELYRVPSTDAVVGYVRSQILISYADSKGIKVTDEDVKQAIKENYGIEGDENVEALAKQIGITTDQLKKLVSNQVKTEKLVEYLMGDPKDLPKAPERPEAPEKGQEDVASEQYANYIIKAVGPAWNEQEGKWADENSPFAMTLVGENAFDGKKATFTQASIVFSILAQEYQETMSKNQMKAIEDINAQMANASINVRTLAQ